MVYFVQDALKTLSKSSLQMLIVPNVLACLEVLLFQVQERLMFVNTLAILDMMLIILYFVIATSLNMHGIKEFHTSSM